MHHLSNLSDFFETTLHKQACSASQVTPWQSDAGKKAPLRMFPKLLRSEITWDEFLVTYFSPKMQQNHAPLGIYRMTYGATQQQNTYRPFPNRKFCHALPDSVPQHKVRVWTYPAWPPFNQGSFQWKVGWVAARLSDCWQMWANISNPMWFGSIQADPDQAQSTWH